MMEELSEDLDGLGSPFPCSTKLVAFRGFDYFGFERRELIKWELRVFVAGPDARYNPGKATVSSCQVPGLARVLREVKKKADALQAVTFSGKYNEAFCTSVPNLSFELSAEGGCLSVQIWISNDTRWRFSRRILISDIDKAIAILDGLDERGTKMVETLEVILGKRDVLGQTDASGTKAKTSLDRSDAISNLRIPPPPPPPSSLT